MPRNPRLKSISGYYHIMQRGVGRQILFEDDNDRSNYLNLLKNYSKKYEVSIIAYCIMDNHVHIVAKSEALENNSKMISCISICYAQYYNEKYSHVGHVFQGRYKSQIIESEYYLLRCVLYVHNNPKAAGYCEQFDYIWSSFKEYDNRIEIDGFVDTACFVELIGGLDAFKEQSKNYSCCRQDEKMFEDLPARVTMDDAEKIVKTDLGLENGLMVKSLNKDERNRSIIKLLDGGVSIRKIERLTGVSRGVIQRIDRNTKR